MGGSGLILALCKCRMWMVYALSCTIVSRGFDYMVRYYSPFRTPLLAIKPDATMEGFAAGVVVTFLLFTYAMYITIFSHGSWFMLVPQNLFTLIPFDKEGLVAADGPLYTKDMRKVEWISSLGVEPLQFVASEFMMHLFVITLFISFVAPFAGYLVSSIR